jgi:hypothetical protein
VDTYFSAEHASSLDQPKRQNRATNFGNFTSYFNTVDILYVDT